jgi:hypothetical protein
VQHREYYNSHIAALNSSTLERAVLQFRNTSPYITDFSTSPCLFPVALRPIADVAVVYKSDYIRLEGQRMVKIVTDAVTQRATQQQRNLAKHKNNRNRERPSPLKQTTLTYNADGQLRLAEKQQPRIVSMAQLQAIHKSQQAFSEYVTSEQITSGWSSYNGSEIPYMNSLEFHVVQERNLALHDDVILLFHDSIETKDTGHRLMSITASLT